MKEGPDQECGCVLNPVSPQPAGNSRSVESPTTMGNLGVKRMIDLSCNAIASHHLQQDGRTNSVERDDVEGFLSGVGIRRAMVVQGIEDEEIGEVEEMTRSGEVEQVGDGGEGSRRSGDVRIGCCDVCVFGRRSAAAQARRAMTNARTAGVGGHASRWLKAIGALGGGVTINQRPSQVFQSASRWSEQRACGAVGRSKECRIVVTRGV
nr:hypothetical protein CFP56_28554 [Quercus suber]